MSTSQPVGLADTFVLILDSLCRAAAARMARDRATAPLLMLLWTRLRRIMARFAALAANPQPPRPTAPRQPRQPRPALPRTPYPRLPRGFAWLCGIVPGSACNGTQLAHLMAQPEFSDLLDKAPQVGRLLRPLCRMLGIPDLARPTTIGPTIAVHTERGPETPRLPNAAQAEPRTVSADIEPAGTPQWQI